MESLLKFVPDSIQGGVGIIVLAVPVLFKVYRQWKQKKKLKTIAKTMVDFADKVLSEMDDDQAYARKKDLQTAHEIMGTQNDVRKTLKEVKDDRGKSGLELGVDIDENMNWKAGAKWRIPLGRRK